VHSAEPIMFSVVAIDATQAAGFLESRRRMKQINCVTQICAPMNNRSCRPKTGIVWQYIGPSSNGAPGAGFRERFDFLRIGNECAS
jgi:hypothetical protein